MTIKVYAAGGKGVIELYGFIGESFWEEGNTAKSISRQLKALGKVSEIDVRINSVGGSVFDGMAIYALLKDHEAEITVHIDGLAASIASVIAMAGDSIVMPTSALMMIHNPHAGLRDAEADDMRKTADLLDKIAGQMADVYAERSGNDREEILGLMAEETWLTGEEAVSQGFATEANTELDIAACADFDKSPKFTNAPDLSAFTAKPAPAGAKTKEAKTMPKEKVKTAAPAPAANNNPEANAPTASDFKAAETSRRGEIRSTFGVHAEAHADLLGECLDDMDITPEAASKKLLTALGEKAQPVGQIIVGTEASEKFVAGATLALSARAGLAERDTGNEFNGMRLSEIAAMCIRRAGGSTRGLSSDAIGRKILAMGTSDFPLLTSNLANKTLRDSYMAFETTWEKWCKKGEVSDFKLNSRLMPGSFGNLKLKPEGGEYEFDEMGEDRFTIQAATKGKAIRMTREMIVNDDLGAFVDQGARLGRAAARTVNADAFAALAMNAADGNPLFHSSNHKNHSSSASVISVDSVSAGKSAMRLQRDAGGNDVVGVRPSYLLVPVALEDAALAFVQSETDPSKTNSKTVNVHRGTLEVVSDPALDLVSASEWYLAAAAQDMPLVEVAFLDGNSTPYTDEETEFLTDSLIHIARLDYGVAPGDFRAGWKNGAE